jgi:hypothetical protein
MGGSYLNSRSRAPWLWPRPALISRAMSRVRYNCSHRPVTLSDHFLAMFAGLDEGEIGRMAGAGRRALLLAPLALALAFCKSAHAWSMPSPASKHGACVLPHQREVPPQPRSEAPVNLSVWLHWGVSFRLFTMTFSSTRGGDSVTGTSSIPAAVVAPRPSAVGRPRLLPHSPGPSGPPHKRPRRRCHQP